MHYRESHYCARLLSPAGNGTTSISPRRRSSRPWPEKAYASFLIRRPKHADLAIKSEILIRSFR